MSSLIQTAVRRVAMTARTAAVSAAPRAAFSATTQFNKTVTESAKDTLKSVDRAVSDKLVDGINIGSSVAGKMKEAGEEVTSGKATGKAAELRGEAKGKASELSGEAKGKANELAGKAKGKAEQVQNKL